MITRTYVVQMPEESPTAPLDILVVNTPGSPDAPALPGDGKYYEWRGRPLRIPVLAAEGASAGFVPRTRLGFIATISPIAAAVSPSLPGVQLSESLASLASTDSGPSINIPTLSDPNGQPAIRLIGDASTAGLFFVVTLMCPEAKDEDRNGTAGP
jgi:hypothetical protein